MRRNSLIMLLLIATFPCAALKSRWLLWDILGTVLHQEKPWECHLCFRRSPWLQRQSCRRAEQLKWTIILDALVCSAFESGKTWIFRIHCSGHLRLTPQRWPLLLQTLLLFHCRYPTETRGSREKCIFVTFVTPSCLPSALSSFQTVVLNKEKWTKKTGKGVCTRMFLSSLPRDSCPLSPFPKLRKSIR